MEVKHLPADHPIQQVDAELLAQLVAAQRNLLSIDFNTAHDLAARVVADLRIQCPLPQKIKDEPPSALSVLSFRELVQFWTRVLVAAGFPGHGVPLQSSNLAQQTQLVVAFEDAAGALERVRAKVEAVVNGFPRTSADLERGKNPGDVLDPYILAATQFLMCGGNFEQAVGHTVAHKAMMMIEGLLGHLHEDVIGMMRGNVRAPEPRGADQETLNPKTNPFPGADIVQPPWSASRGLRFHQVKSKTGSAKGGDGRRLGEQLRRLQDLYGGDSYYHALIGNTLRGHRSRAGVERASPSTVVLVGSASFEELTGSRNGAHVLLRVYQSAFTEVAFAAEYRVDAMAAAIVATFQDRVRETGDAYLEGILRDVCDGDAQQQDSRLNRRSR